jgi:hypothetical protein
MKIRPAAIIGHVAPVPGGGSAAAASRSPARDALDFARGRINSRSIASRARPARTGALK